jgi:uncharacterized protein with PIN domain
MNGDNRYHGEIQITIKGSAARINVFSDTLQQLFKDLAVIHAHFAKADATTLADQSAAKAKPQEFPPARTTEAPSCPECGTNEFMQLIEFTDKKTGKLRKAWKCQGCNKWYWPPRNGGGQ